MKTIKDFTNEDYDYVVYRIATKDWQDKFLQDDSIAIHNSIFSGCFAIKDGVIKSLDGDTYSEDEEVIWSKTWTNEKEGIDKGLSIIVKKE